MRFPTRPDGESPVGLIGITVAILCSTLATNLSAQTTFVVNSADDGDDGSCDATHCSLREAITAANHDAVGGIIHFNIPGPGPHTIQPISALPALEGDVIIDGTSEPDFAGTPVIEVDGSLAGEAHGFDLVGSQNLLRGLVINRFAGNGITVNTDCTFNVIEGNFIGTDVTGTLDLGNGNVGVLIGQAANNTVGGTTAASRNLISGNPEGVTIVDPTATGNVVAGNYIGTDWSGTAAVPNGVGVLLLAPNNTVGGTAAGSGNLISGNTVDGITLGPGNATGNLIAGNYIGTDATGSTAVGNGDSGVAIHAGDDNTIGGTDSGAGNVLSGNTFGILIHDLDATGNVIRGNYIGTNAAGDAAIPNTQTGVLLWGQNTIIGGTEAGAGNVISGNGFAGIDLGGGSTGTVIRGNYIGTDAAGTTALGNDLALFVNFSPNNIIGGTEAGARNVISGNSGGNITVNGVEATGNLIQGNYIGTDRTGTIGLEGGRAMSILDAPGNTVGGAGSGAGNLIAGNGNGILIDGPNASGNVIQGNYIGVDVTGSAPLENGGAGVRLSNGAAGNTIGGTVSGAGNIIANSRWMGVILFGDAGTGNRIQSNAIFDNSALGIELGRNSVTPNDEGDADTGPNELQNYPVLTSVASGSGAVIQASLNSISSSSYTLEFFSNTACDDSGFGQGETPLGTAMVTTDASGNGTVATSFSSVSGSVFTATATDANGNTSEFSLCSEATTLEMSSSPTTRTVTPGQSAAYTIALTAQGGVFQETVDLSCSGAPSGTTCTFSSDELNLASGQASTTMTVTTVAPAESSPPAPRPHPHQGPTGWPWIVLLAISGVVVLLRDYRISGGGKDGHRSRMRTLPRARWGALAGLGAVLLILQTSCGKDGASPPTGGTPAGTYELTVTATWETAQTTSTATLIVQ